MGQIAILNEKLLLHSFHFFPYSTFMGRTGSLNIFLVTHTTTRSKWCSINPPIHSSNMFGRGFGLTCTPISCIAQFVEEESDDPRKSVLHSFLIPFLPRFGFCCVCGAIHSWTRWRRWSRFYIVLLGGWECVLVHKHFFFIAAAASNNPTNAVCTQPVSRLITIIIRIWMDGCILCLTNNDTSRYDDMFYIYVLCRHLGIKPVKIAPLN